MYRINGKTFRNIQEQVEENKKQIEGFENIQFVLNNFGITVLGVIDDIEDAPEMDYEYGDAWLVGLSAPYNMYVFTRDQTPGSDGEFVNLGALSITGPQGPAGTIQINSVSTGAAGSAAEVTNIGTQTNAVLNFKIPQGIQGETGNGIYNIVKTDTSGLEDTYTINFTDGNSTTFLVTNGADGTDGQDGDPGESFMIMGIINNTSLLPDPSTTPRNQAYIYNDGDIATADRIYYITGAVGSEVWSYSSFAAAGTTVSVNNSPVYLWNADTKLDKDTTTTTYGKVYAKAPDGTNGMVDLDTSVMSGSIPRRDSNGAIMVPWPTSGDCAASKTYVDTGVLTKQNKMSIVDYTASGAITLANYTSFRCSATTASVSITVGNILAQEFYCEIYMKQPTTITTTGTINWTGDDCVNGNLTPTGSDDYLACITNVGISTADLIAFVRRI